MVQGKSSVTARLRLGGGAVATRGLLVQALVAILDVAHAEPAFEEIALEPSIGDNQFDFVWRNACGSHAVQVKSTVNFFRKSQVTRWARQLAAVRTDEHCRLVLVGHIHPALVGVDVVERVEIEVKHMNLEDLVEQAAHRLRAFMEREEIPAGSTKQAQRLVDALTSRLQYHAAIGGTMSRGTFVSLLREWISNANSVRRIDVSRIGSYAPERLVGRGSQVALLDRAWAKAVTGTANVPRILVFVALGGEGKTSLVAKWIAQMATANWRGCDTAFAWSFYSQGSREQGAPSSDPFFAEALTFFGDPVLARSAAAPVEKARRLVQLAGAQRTLLILDGLEPLQHPPSASIPGRLKDQALAVLLKGLAASSKGLCIVTTRYSIPELNSFSGGTVTEYSLARLSKAAGVALLKTLGVKGSLRKVSITRSAPALNEFESVVEDVKGHALTLTILGSYLRDAHGGDIRKRHLVGLAEANAAEQGGHAFRVMDAYVRWLAGEERGCSPPPQAAVSLAMLRLLGLFDRPATGDRLRALWAGEGIAGLTEELRGAQWNVALSRLAGAKLAVVHHDSSGELISIDAHPLVREYFAKRLQDELPESWRASHRRLYEYLCTSTPDKADASLEDLRPLYDAVRHGCLAGLQQQAYNEVWLSRIRRENETNYSARVLGAFGSDLEAIACFFDVPWSRVSSALEATTQAIVVAYAAYTLRGLGRLTEAVEPMRTGIQMGIQSREWNEVSRRANNLSELHVTLGDLGPSLSAAEESIKYADLSGDAFMRMVSRATWGYTLHQTGRHDDAFRAFAGAEQLLRTDSNAPSRFLYSVRGFMYCELLLLDAERAAWEAWLTILQLRQVGTDRRTVDSRRTSAPRDAAPWHGVLTRVSETMPVAKKSNSLLAIGLDYLTRAHAEFYERQLWGTKRLMPSDDINAAVDTLRAANRNDYLPRALLTRSWMGATGGACSEVDGAVRDLDEAWEIAERGSMKLFMADIHLYRAGLFFGAPRYPWTSASEDVAAASTLVKTCGYARREPQLNALTQAVSAM